ncbi:MAG: MFS transporter [archaeon]
MKKEDKIKNKALNISITEGSANSFSTGISNSFITPFALKLSPSELNIGILSSVSGLLSPLAQLYGSKLMATYARKNIVLKSIIWQAILWLPLALIALLKFYGVYENSLIYLLIIGYSLITALGGLGHPAWFSWMGDLISDKNKGKYFARRNIITGIVELIAVALATLIIQSTENQGLALWGFAIIFILSFIFRTVSFLLIKNQYSPHAKSRKTYSTTLMQLIKENKNYRRFAIYHLFFNIALMIASPFFAVYMLKELHFSYVQYIIVATSGSIFYLIFTPLAGKFSDKYGNVKLLLISNILFAINPLFWIFIKSPLLLTIIPQLVSGAANAAIIIAVTNFSYDYLKEEERGIGIAYSNLSAGIGVFVGSIAGGLLLDYLNISFMNIFFFVFLLAAFLRIIVALIFLPRIKETKKVKRIPAMHVSLTHPFKTVHSEISWVRHVFR